MSFVESGASVSPGNEFTATDRGVIIVGAGIAGLAVSVALARQGKASTILEARHRRDLADKGDVLHESSIRLLEKWKVYEAVLGQNPVRVPTFDVLDGYGSVMLHFDFARDLDPPTRVLALQHSRIEHVLETAALKTGLVQIRRGDVVQDLSCANGRVDGVVTSSGVIRASLVVLANGRHGRLSRRFFKRCKEHDYSMHFYNLRGTYDGSTLGGAYVLGHRGVLVLVPLPHNEMRVGIQRRHKRGQRPWTAAEARMMIAQRLQSPMTDHFEVAALQIYPLTSFVLDSFWRPGLAVVGDAAHTVHPAGGQGMNLAFQDADRLATAICADTVCGGSDRALSEYSRQRIREVARVFRRSHFLGLAGRIEGRWSASCVRIGLALLNSMPSLRRRFFQAITLVR